jgi:outer membrane biosynthesis protein TonB
LNREPIFIGVSLTVLLHVGLIFLTISHGDTLGCDSGGGAQAQTFEEAETIEASLAYKKVSPKDKQPQKQKKEKYAPVDQIKLSNDASQTPEEVKKPDHPITPTEDEIDPASVLRKNRQQDENLSSTGTDELPQEGADDGSEWGTALDARGDPYVGELVGRVKSAWAIPSLEAGSGTAVGCVRLAKDGSITDRELKERSKNANLDRSVEEAMRAAPAMEAPVPDHLVQLLTVRGICINFKL